MWGWVAMLALPIVPLALTYIGWRGRRVDDHPLCRRCRFDLTGRPPDSTRCPECGADLGAPRAITIGHRQRRAVEFYCGLAMAIPMLLVLATTVFISARDLDITPYKPNWLLKRDLASIGPVAGKALAELSVRVQAPKSSLSDADVSDVANLCLAKQGNRTLTWDPAWGRFIEAAHAANRLPADKWSTYAKQALDVVLTVRPTVRQGDNVPLGLTAQTARVAGAQFVALFDWPDIRIDGTPAAEPMRNASGIHGHNGSIEMRGNGGGTTYYNPEIKGERSAALPPGSHVLSLKLAMAVYDASAVGRDDQGSKPSQADLAATTLELRAPFAVFERGRAPQVVLTDESLRPKVERAVKVNSVQVERGGRRVVIDFSFNEPPMRVAFRVTVRAPGGAEFEVGSGEGWAGHNNGHVTSGVADLRNTDHVEVLFHPNPEAATRSTDASPIWSGNVIVKDVPVKPAAAPSTQP